MTCIVFTPEMVAWDTLISGENFRLQNEYSQKVQVVNGCIYGFAGTAHGHMELIEWHQNGAKPDEFPRATDVTMAVMTLDGVEMYYHDHVLACYMQCPVAIGSGAYTASIALYMGADARKAVEVATKFDPYTGGRVMTLDPRGLLKSRMKVSTKGLISGKRKPSKRSTKRR